MVSLLSIRVGNRNSMRPFFFSDKASFALILFCQSDRETANPRNVIAQGTLTNPTFVFTKRHVQKSNANCFRCPSACEHIARSFSPHCSATSSRCFVQLRLLRWREKVTRATMPVGLPKCECSAKQGVLPIFPSCSMSAFGSI